MEGKSGLMNILCKAKSHLTSLLEFLRNELYREIKGDFHKKSLSNFHPKAY